MIIFGTSGRTKDLGEAVPAECPRCHNRTFFRYLTRTRWFSLFFIPVIPFSSKHSIVCPVCSYAVPLDDEGRQRAGHMVELTGRWRAGALSDEAYRASVAEYIQGQMHGSVEALPPSGGLGSSNPPPIPPPPTSEGP